MEDKPLAGKVALVTGAGRGIGRSIALTLARNGVRVALASRTLSELEAVRAEIETAGGEAASFPADISVESDAVSLVERSVDRFGRLDILVNNAGIIRRAPALEFSEKDWDDVLQINLKATFFLSQAAAKVMVKRGEGKIINVASMLSFQGGIIVPSYTAAKSAIAGVTRALANEWAKHNININAIAPGYMATDNTAPLRADPARSQTILDRIPAGRWGTPDDLKGIVVFLASAASDYMNGAIVPVDGGWLAR
jgi:2-deoxy-D-gluconate 3-dehydrogenase